jgi:hypothetical protein
MHFFYKYKDECRFFSFFKGLVCQFIDRFVFFLAAVVYIKTFRFLAYDLVRRNERFVLEFFYQAFNNDLFHFLILPLNQILYSLQFHNDRVGPVRPPLEWILVS